MAAAGRTYKLRAVDTDLILTPDELDIIIHALTEEYERVKIGGGTHYGPLPLERLNLIILRFRNAQTSTLKRAA